MNLDKHVQDGGSNSDTQSVCGLRPYHTILHGDDFRCTYQADAANQQVAARDRGDSHAMVVEPDRMH